MDGVKSNPARKHAGVYRRPATGVEIQLSVGQGSPNMQTEIKWDGLTPFHPLEWPSQSSDIN